MDKENKRKEKTIAKLKKEHKACTTQLKGMKSLYKVVQDEKDTLISEKDALVSEKDILKAEKEKLIKERNHFAMVAQHTEDKAHKMAEELQQIKSTVKEMRVFLVLRTLCPRYLDPWFITFSVFIFILKP